MRPTAADAFRIAVEDGNLAVELGRFALPSPDEPGGVVTLSDRVVIAPETAARLLVGLREALARRAEAPTEDGGPAPDSLSAPSGIGATPANLPPDPAATASARLLDRIRALGVPYGYERSFRLSAAGLQANRFLVSMNRADLGADALDRTLAVGRELGMPEEAQRHAREQFEDARCVHFGFEAGDGAIVGKLYLERGPADDEVARATERGEGVLLHLAFKWDVRSGAHVVTRYDWFPALSAAAIEARLRALYAPAEDGESARIACELLALAAARGGELPYLEVREPDNGRRSFDLNLYDAGLAVRDALPLLLRMRDLHGVRPGQFQALLDQIKGRPLGHLAGGAHRDGRDFFNVYYGATGFPKYSSRLG